MDHAQVGICSRHPWIHRQYRPKIPLRLVQFVLMERCLTRGEELLRIYQLGVGGAFPNRGCALRFHTGRGKQHKKNQRAHSYA